MHYSLSVPDFVFSLSCQTQLIYADYFISFKLLLSTIIEAKQYDNEGLACTVSTAQTVLPIYCQQINMTIVAV